MKKPRDSVKLRCWCVRRRDEVSRSPRYAPEAGYPEEHPTTVQRRRSNSLRQRDLELADARWLITILDDHSRYVTGGHMSKDATAENVIWPLDQAIHEHAKLGAMLTDHGS